MSHSSLWIDSVGGGGSGSGSGGGKGDADDDIDEDELPARKIWVSAARRRLSIAERGEFADLLSAQISSAARCYSNVLIPESRRLLSFAAAAKKEEGVAEEGEGGGTRRGEKKTPGTERRASC